MDMNYIKILLENFYNGETTPEEERILLNYFKNEEIAPELLTEKELFLQLFEKETIDIPVGLESNLENLIDELDAKEAQTPKVILSQQSNKRSLWKWVGGIAAGLALLITGGVYLNKESSTIGMPVQTSTITQISEVDQRKIKEAQDALILISKNLNKGVDQLSMVSDNLDKTNNILDKTFNRKNEK